VENYNVKDSDENTIVTMIFINEIILL